MGAKSKEIAYAIKVQSETSMLEPQTFYTLSTYCCHFVTFLGTSHNALAVGDLTSNSAIT
jgi:hypothetical protein